MFLMAFDIPEIYGFADYESERTRGQIKMHILVVLLIHFWIYYHLLILLIDFIINYY